MLIIIFSLNIGKQRNCQVNCWNVNLCPNKALLGYGGNTGTPDWFYIGVRLIGEPLLPIPLPAKK